MKSFFLFQLNPNSAGGVYVTIYKAIVVLNGSASLLMNGSPLPLASR